jgi:hypothetical protein
MVLAHAAWYLHHTPTAVHATGVGTHEGSNLQELAQINIIVVDAYIICADSRRALMLSGRVQLFTRKQSGLCGIPHKPFAHSRSHSIDLICQAYKADPPKRANMVSAAAIKKRLQSILEEADLDVITERKVIQQLVEDFGEDAKKHTDLVKKGIEEL